ncbi:conserved hypothetical protein [Burkholderia diffusa]|nr:conserved hypothetical protein [Burkholderia diffusa]
MFYVVRSRRHGASHRPLHGRPHRIAKQAAGRSSRRYARRHECIAKPEHPPRIVARPSFLAGARSRSRDAYCTWNFGDVATVPLTVQSGVNTALLNVSDEFGSLHVVTTLLGPQAPSSETVTFALLIDSCVVLSAWPVHGDALVALPLIRPHVAAPVNVVDVMLTMPVEEIVPLNVALQVALIEPLARTVRPVAENGSPFGFMGCPSARETVTAKAGAAETAVNATAATSDTILRMLI